MSEPTAKFRIKKDDIEIEYEGTPKEVDSRFGESFEWIKTVGSSSEVHKDAKERESKGAEKDSKKDKRGGARSPLLSKAIDDLIEEGFFDSFKTVKEVFEELKRKAIPVSSLPAVRTPMNRRVADKLDRNRDENNKWVYHKKSG